jgi:23S rRNA (cytidine1920-2'-O)/16S rRNA (cytidine1409-2'-O)-methyltransferase
LTTVLPSLVCLVVADGDLLLMVKPQFEVGRARLSRGGVVRDPAIRAIALDQVVTTAADLGMWPVAGTVSPLPGPAGNVEFFVWLRSGSPPAGTSWDEADSTRLSSADLPPGAVVRAR